MDEKKPRLSESGESSRKRGSGSEEGEGSKKKRSKRSSGKACVYCRRSHMVCEGGRPCERCVRREIAHLCRDVSPVQNRRPSDRAPSASPVLEIGKSNQDTAGPVPQISNQTVSQNQYIAPVQSQPQMQNQGQSQNRLPTSLYSDPNFPPAWPLLPDSEGPVTYGNGNGANGNGNDNQGMNGNWGQVDDSELGALTKFLGDLGVPSLPGGFLDVLSFFSQGGSTNQTLDNSINLNNLPGIPDNSINNNNSNNNFNDNTANNNSNTNMRNQSFDASQFLTDAPGPSAMPVQPNPPQKSTSNGNKGKAKEVSFAAPSLTGVSRIEKYFLAAADQPSGPRASRLAQVIKAKYDAGLLKPYDYVKGYERMNKWMDSGRAAPKADSIHGSAPNSPRGGRGRMISSTPGSAYGGSISFESRRRILTALNGFRPKFRQIARTLTDVDLVFVEEAMERWMLEYDRAFASIHTPSCIWRRTGEIQKANQEFANLTGIPASMFRNGILCVYELMDEDSAVRYWEGYAKIAFDAGQRSLTIHCTLKIPMSLTRSKIPRPSATPASTGTRPSVSMNTTVIPDFSLPQALIASNTHSGGQIPNASPQISDGGFGQFMEEYREIKCCFSVTIRRDAWGVPVAIMGQWIPI